MMIYSGQLSGKCEALFSADSDHVQFLFMFMLPECSGHQACNQLVARVATPP